MPPGRPPKRASDGSEEGLGLNSPSGPKPKQARLERGPEDFSSVVKNKLQSYTRTGQACDRCKVRKIRCDALPEGCSHCISQNLDCFVTDRVTGRTERRGYMQQLEREKMSMLTHIRDMEKLLQNNGIEVRPWEWRAYGQYPPGFSYDSMGNAIPDTHSKDQWAQRGTLWVKNHQGASHGLAAPGSQRGGIYSNNGYTRHSLLESRPSEGFLGVHPDKAPLSSIKGTKLSILGTTIDMTSFDAPDMDEPAPGTAPGSPLYNKSLGALYKSVLGLNPKLDNIDLPSRQDAFDYSEWYFLMIHPFMPVLHKPSFYTLLQRIYDEEGFKPTTCELVTAHMVFALIFFQYGVRGNRDEPENQARLNDLSNKHYHWALGQFYDLAIDNSITAVQGLAMIAMHTRNFPKPGCSSTVVKYALHRAIELNLHRAVKLPGGGTSTENEVRKRVWWSILGLAVTLNGRLGRPMPIALEEFDVELPVAVSDQYITDEGITEAPHLTSCEFLAGITTFRMVPLYLEMFSTIYSVRRDPTKYVDVVCGLEQGMKAVESSIPDELRLDKCPMDKHMFALYLEGLHLEFRLCLRHPSVCMTNDANFCAENTRICEETARKLLDVVTRLLDLQCLDTTWYQFSVYVAAIFTSLVAHWERRLVTTPDEILKLRTEMEMWMRVVNEIGVTLGTGVRISHEIGGIIDRTIKTIERDMTNASRRNSNAEIQQVAAGHDNMSQSGYPQNGFKAEANGGQELGVGVTVTDFGREDQQRNVMTSNNNNNGDNDNNNSNNNNPYYDPAMTGAVGAEYTATTSYPEQATTVNHTPSGNNNSNNHNNNNNNGMTAAGSYDANTNAQYLYAQVTNNGNTSGMNHAGEAENPLIAFASQAAAQVGAGHGAGVVGEWRQSQDNLAAAAAAAAAAQAQAQAQAQSQVQAHGGTSWHDWTAAMADNQTERYSANALLNLGGGRPADGNADTGAGGGVSVSVSADMGLVGAPGPPGHAGQWPLLLFHDANGAVGGPPATHGQEAVPQDGTAKNGWRVN